MPGNPLANMQGFWAARFAGVGMQGVPIAIAQLMRDEFHGWTMTNGLSLMGQFRAQAFCPWL
jgi:hypothetical protein